LASLSTTLEKCSGEKRCGRNAVLDIHSNQPYRLCPSHWILVWALMLLLRVWKQERARKWEKELEAANKEKEGEVLRPIDPTTAAQLHPS
jgi:type VI protein secretion system component VasK